MLSSFPAWLAYRLDRALVYLLFSKGHYGKFRYAYESIHKNDVLNSFLLLCLSRIGQFAEVPFGDGL
jgi:hypothetical protein